MVQSWWEGRLLPISLGCEVINSLSKVSGGEEGEDDAKSAWPLCPGLHTWYNGRYKGSRSRKAELIPSKAVSVRIEVCNPTS